MNTERLTKSKEMLELESTIRIISKRSKNTKARLLDLEIKQKELENQMSLKIKEHMTEKIRKVIIKESEITSKDILSEVLRKVENGYLAFINKIVAASIAATISKKIMFETKIFKNSDINVKNILKLYDKGWRIAFYGKLGNRPDEIVILDKPKSSKQEE